LGKRSPAARRRRVDHRIGQHHPQSARFLHDLPAHRGAGPAWVSDFTAWIADRMEVNAIDDVLHAVDRAPRRTRQSSDPRSYPAPVRRNGRGADGESLRARRLHASTTYAVLAMDVYAFGEEAPAL
jgi:4,5-DOPA dioxygenase extradiol